MRKTKDRDSPVKYFFVSGSFWNNIIGFSEITAPSSTAKDMPYPQMHGKNNRTLFIGIPSGAITHKLPG